MEPRIQYAQTKDGVSIAFWTLGEGMPLVHMPAAFSHIQMEWQWPGARRWYERLAEKRKLVRYDGRGTGLSERDVSDYSIDARVLDLEAVVDRLDLERFALLGPHDWGPVAIAYAVRRPQRVSHLVLWCTYAKTSDPPWVRAMDKLIEKDWEIATETLAHGLLGWSADEQARQFAAFIRESVTPDAVMALSTAADEFDVNDLLAQVRAPTLVLHRRQFSFPKVDVARGLASQIPNARLALLEGESPAPFLGDTDAVLEAVDEFLGEGEGEEVAAYAAPSGLVTILFTDMEGSTTLTQRIGDARAQEVLHAHNAIVRDALKAHGGSETKHTGDGIMASFTTASRALACAIAMQRAFAAHNRGVEAALAPPQGAASDDPTAPTATEPIRVRVGLNAGEPVAEGDPDGRADLFGTAVQLAARICAHAEPGQILASNVVQELAAGKDFAFADQGDVALKGFEKPVRLFEVRWREGA